MEYTKQSKAGPKSPAAQSITAAVAPLPTWTAPEPTPLQRLAADLSHFTSLPVKAQGQAVQPVLQAARLQRAEEERLTQERTAAQRQLAALPSANVTPPRAAGALSAHPASVGDWVTVMRRQAEQINGQRLSSQEHEGFLALQRRVAQTLVQGFRQDRQTPDARYAYYSEHLATLQRHPNSAPVSRVVLGLIPQRERLPLQRAVDRAVQRQAEQDSQEQAAGQRHTLQRKKAELDEEALQPVMQRIAARRGAGNPLPAATQRHLEQGLNHDLSRVRIHDDAEAHKLSQKVNALAFTTGTDIFFQSGQFNPNTQSGLELLAHEVTHTVQQSRGQVGTGIDPDAGLEAEARTMGAKLASQKPLQTTGAAGVGSVPAAPHSAPSVLQRRTATSPTPQPPTVGEVVAAILALRNPAGVVVSPLPLLQRAMTAADAKFWNQVVVQGSQRYGKNFAKDALATLPVSLRAPFTLALLGGEQELTYAAFINQLAYMSYSNAPDLSDAKQVPATAQASTRDNVQAILKAAGYRALPTIHGLWGLQIRVFQPTSSRSLYNKTIVAFRGTEGVDFSPSADPPVNSSAASQTANESSVDTLADLAAYQTAYSQYEANETKIIAPLLAKLGGNLVATGHSLGGGLAQIAVARHPKAFSEVYTFQGASIKQADVDRLSKQNKTLKARHFRVGGDAVPTSGNAAIKGQVFDLDRRASLRAPLTKEGVFGWFTATPDAAGGHNSPLALEMLEEAQQARLLSPGNALAQVLLARGSQDPKELSGFPSAMSLIGTYGTAQDTTPGKEELKQNTTGTVFMPQFISTYQNNAVYNILVETSLDRLKAVAPGQDAARLVRSLRILGQESIREPLKHSPSSLLTLGAIFDRPLARLSRAAANAAEAPQLWVKAPQTSSSVRLRQLQQQRDAFVNLKFDPKVVAENQERFRRNLPSLWYAVHPGSERLYLEVLQQW